jgi:hypothetical protein
MANTQLKAMVGMIFGVYLIVAEYGATKLYNYWAVLSLDIFLVIFWLCACGLLAAQTTYFLAFGVSVYSSYYGTYVNSELSSDGYIWAACLAGAAGLGGIQFILFVVSLIMHSVMLHRHRKAGLRCNPVASIGVGAAGYAKPSTASTPTQSHQQLYSTPMSYPLVPPQNAAGYASPQQPQQAHTPHQQAHDPLSAEHTGGSFTMPPQRSSLPAAPTNAYEVPNNQVPYQEASGGRGVIGWPNGRVEARM